MKNRTVRRGSAMMIVIFTATAVGVTVIAGVSLSAIVSRNQSQRERKLKLKYVTEGAIQMAHSDLSAGRLSLGATKIYHIGGIPVKVEAFDNSDTLSGTVRLAVNGTTPDVPIALNRTVAYVPRTVWNVWSHGVYSNGGFTFPVPGTSTVVGSAYFRSSISILGTGQVTKDFRTSSSFNPLGLLAIGGAILTGLAPISYPTLVTAEYQASADTVLSGNQVLNGYTFPRDGALTVILGNLTLRGTIVRQGTFFVTGTVTVNGDVVRQDSSLKLAVLTPNDITFSGPGSKLAADGYYFAGGKMTLTDKVTTTGALVANSFSVGSTFTINWDPWATQTDANGQSLKLPSMWP